MEKSFSRINIIKNINNKSNKNDNKKNKIEDKENDKMRSLLRKQLEKNDIKENTIKTYISVLMNLKGDMGYNKNDIRFIFDKEGIEKTIKNRPLTSKRTIYNSILNILKKTKEDELKTYYYNKMLKDKETYETKEKDNKKTKQQEEKWGDLTYDKLLKIPELIKNDLMKIKKKDKTYQFYILSLFLYKHKILGRNELSSFIITNKKNDIMDNKNYLYIQKNKITMFYNDYKNVDSLGKKEVELDDNLRNELIDFIKNRTSLTDTNYLFYNINKDKPYDNKRFTELIQSLHKKYINKKLSINDLRHIKSIWIEKTFKTYNEKEREHKNLLHSYNTGLLYVKN